MESDFVKNDIYFLEELVSEIPLPDELLSEIISRYVPLCHWSRYLENVSKQFQRCVWIAYSRIKDIKCGKLFSLKCFAKDRTKFCAAIRLNCLLEKLSAVCPNLADIAGLTVVNWDILRQFDSLQSISLHGILNVVFRSLSNFVANSKSLKALSITKCEFDYAGTLDVGSLSDLNFQIKPCWRERICLANLSEKLITLTLNNFVEFFENPKDAMKKCCNLESFSIRLCSKNDYEIFLANLPYLCKLISLSVSVNRFTLSPCDFNMQFCEQLYFLKNQLQCIDFKDTVLREEIQCFLLTECVKLRCLRFNRSFVLSANAAKNLPRLSALENFSFEDHHAQMLPVVLPSLVKLTNFTDLTVTGNTLFNWEGFENVCCLVHLQHLQINDIGAGDALFKLWDNKNPEMFEKLVTFKIRDCAMSDVGAILVAKKARNLKVLYFGGSRISEKTISILADVAKKLIEVELPQSKPLLFDENDIIGLIKKAICLKKVKISEELVNKIREHKNFLPFVEYVEISTSYGY